MLRLATYNIQYGRGKDDCFDIERIAGEVAGADIIALQEVETFAERSEMIDQVGVIHRGQPTWSGAALGPERGSGERVHDPERALDH